MTVITLTDVARMRLESLSFFIFAYLFMALLVKWLWNYLAKAFTQLPRLNYRRALALSLISGLFLYVILTMISGARELLTPGAWEKKGIGYKLKTEQAPDRAIEVEQLQQLIGQYRTTHDSFPPNLYVDEILASGLQKHFAYMPPAPAADSNTPIVYEINTNNRNRYVILKDGTIERWSVDELKQELLKGEY